jgi:hypothetical protein
MTTVTSFLKEIASELSAQQPADSIRKWDFRSEVPNDEIDENKTLIAVLHMTSQEEIVKFNHTLRLYCSLTGQILIGEMTQEEAMEEVQKIWLTIQEYLMPISMKPVEDAILLQATTGGVETGVEGYYINFSIPIDFYVQF